MFDVNFFGALETTRAFIPLLRQHQGRVVMISSVIGKVCYPWLSAYCTTKFALEGMSDALRLELEPFGVSVSVLEPGFIRTMILDNAKDRSVSHPESSEKWYRTFVSGGMVSPSSTLFHQLTVSWVPFSTLYCKVLRTAPPLKSPPMLSFTPSTAERRRRDTSSGLRILMQSSLRQGQSGCYGLCPTDSKILVTGHRLRTSRYEHRAGKYGHDFIVEFEQKRGKQYRKKQECHFPKGWIGLAQ